MRHNFKAIFSLLLMACVLSPAPSFGDASCHTTSPTTSLQVSGVLDDQASIIGGGAGAIPTVPSPGSSSTAVSFTNLSAVADSCSDGIKIYDSLGAQHEITFCAFHTASSTFVVRGYVNSEEVENGSTPVGYPRQIGTLTIISSGGAFTASIPWTNGASMLQQVEFDLSGVTIGNGTGATIWGGEQLGGAIGLGLPSPLTFPVVSSTAPLIKFALNLDASASLLTGGVAGIPSVPAPGSASTIVTFSDLIERAAVNWVFTVQDSEGTDKNVYFFAFHTAVNTYVVRGYIASEEVEIAGAPTGYPRQLGTSSLTFNSAGVRTNASSVDFSMAIPWNNGRSISYYSVSFADATQFAVTSLVCQSAIDYCPTDAAKKTPGICGCGVADTDSDSDGTPDCFDGCSSIAAKTSPGACGCDGADADSDSDGSFDCFDGCPSDGYKVGAGSCGCGASDADANKNGVADCLDPTADTTPTAPTFSGSSRKPTIVFQSFSGRVRYNIQLKYRGKISKDTSETANRSTGDLVRGSWQVRYSVSVGLPGQLITTRFSAWKSFTVK